MDVRKKPNLEIQKPEESNQNLFWLISLPRWVQNLRNQ